MKKIILLLCSIMILVLSGCGSDDTSGALTMTALTSTNVDTTYTVTTTITYAPPSGKSAQGVEVTVVGAVDGVSISPLIHTLTSGSNSFAYSFTVVQGVASKYVSVDANIGGMKASSGIVIPAI